MKRTHTWSVQRQPIRRSDAPTRWDQAYQHLLQWTIDREGARTPLALQQEVADAHCPLRPGLDESTSPSPDH
jgi:hypothetical protein